MLKVVGASWFQTTVSLSILVGILVFGIVLIIVCKWQTTEDDGKFAATVYWNPYTESYDISPWGQNNDPTQISRGVARAYYQSSMHKTGWGILEIDSSGEYPDKTQAFAAGILEGILSWQHIFWQWKNTIEQPCIDREEFCAEMREFLENNTIITKAKATAKDKTNPFWHQVNLFYVQLDGLQYGWYYEMKKNERHHRYVIPEIDFLWMNIMSDFKDVEKIISSPTKSKSTKHSPVAMSLLKLLKNNGTYLLAHASSGFYSSMLRIQKKYNFNYRLTGAPNSQFTPGRRISFTSYPASIHSQDDFYQITLTDLTKITVCGTALNVQPVQTKDDLKNLVLLGPRVMAANRLAKNGSSWSMLVQKYNSGTGNKQWLHVTSKDNNIKLWVLEQLSKKVIPSDETELLHQRGYWIGCGVPHYKENPSRFDVENNTTTYSNYSIIDDTVEILKLGQQNITNIESLVRLMRSPYLSLIGRTDLLFRTNFSNSAVWLTRKAKEGEHVVAPDLGNSSSTKTPLRYIHYNLDQKDFIITQNESWHNISRLKNIVSWARQPSNHGPFIHGIIDLKVMKDGEGFLAAAGPPFNMDDKFQTIEPFQWSKSSINYLPHNGHSDMWNYIPVAADFVWN